MDKLISTARIGRSLGIHLILATQSLPVWLMTRFGATRNSVYASRFKKERIPWTCSNVLTQRKFHKQVGSFCKWALMNFLQWVSQLEWSRIYSF